MTSTRGVLKDALGWACIGVAAVVVGVLLMAGGSGAGGTVAVLGAAVIVVALAAAAYELLRSDRPDEEKSQPQD